MDTNAEEACPVCHTPYRLHLEDVDFDKELLRCHQCGTQQALSILGELGVFAVLYEASRCPVRCTPPPPRPPLPLPQGFQLEQDEQHTALSWRAFWGLKRTRIEATREGLIVRQAPLGLQREELHLERRDLVQLYGQAQRGFLGETYRLCALTRRGRRVILASGFPHKEQALYLEQTLEAQLGIEDSWVKGELAERPPPESWNRQWLQVTATFPLSKEE
jgi:hypothetical protein